MNRKMNKNETRGRELESYNFYSFEKLVSV